MTRPDDATSPDSAASPVDAVPVDAVPVDATGNEADVDVDVSRVDVSAADPTAAAGDDLDDGGRTAAGARTAVLLSDRDESDPSADEPEQGEREWAWVTRWRQENEPTPWGPGLVLALFTAVVVAVAVVVLTQGLGDLPLLAVLINIVVAAGLAPAIWMVRSIPVIRWMGAGMALGLVAGWCAAAAVVTPF